MITPAIIDYNFLFTVLLLTNKWYNYGN